METLRKKVNKETELRIQNITAKAALKFEVKAEDWGKEGMGI